MLDIENRGTGFVPGPQEIGDNWRISQNGSPIILGQTARLGSLNFSGKCDGTSKFTIDNYISVKNFYDSQTSRWMSTFDGHIRNVDTDGKFGQFSMVSKLSALDVTRTSEVNTAGQYQRSIRLPQQVEYVVGATTYYTGGEYRTIGGIEMWSPQPIFIYDIASEEEFIYVLASGMHDGELVFVIGTDGSMFDVWPVYSDATDIANPQTRYITFADGNLWVAQVAADRVKRFDTDGTFLTQWGSAGSLDGQFSTISGIVANGTGLNAVYVVDSTLGRVQCFTDTGTFSFKWGTSGTGTGNTVFNSPNGISIDPKTNSVFVSDRNARVRQYASGGGYMSQPMGSYDFARAESTGEFKAGNYPIQTGFDHLGNAYAVQDGKVFKYVRDNLGWATSSHVPQRTWETRGVEDAAPPTAITVSHLSGMIHIARSQDYVEQYAGSMGTLKSYLLYYVALAAEDFPIRVMILNAPWAVGELAFPSWTGNVWQMLCDLCAVTSNAMVAFDDSIFFLNRSRRVFNLPHDVQVSTVDIDSRATGQSIEIVNQNSTYTVGEEVLYTTQADDRKSIAVDINTFTYLTVSQNTFPEYCVNPTPHTVLANGRYVVTDTNGVVVTPALWTQYGGKISAQPGERPGNILLTVKGPGLDIPGFEAPFRIADAGGTPSLSVMGAGVRVNPETYTIGTGVSEQVTSQLVAQTIDSPFVRDAEAAYTEGSWAAYNAGTPHQRVKFTMRADRTFRWAVTGSGVDGTAMFVGTVIEYDDAQYVVENLDFGPAGISLECYRYTKTGWNIGINDVGPARHEEIWSGKKSSDFDTYWAGYTAQDYTVAPLRNPFGV